MPDDRVIYTGDILFVEGTPILWAGPVQRWIGAWRLIEGLDVEVIDLREYESWSDRELQRLTPLS